MGSLQLAMICGGRGKRLRGINPEGRSKVMLPIHGIPLLGHLWQQYRIYTSSAPIIVHSAKDRSVPDWARTLEQGAILCPQKIPDGAANAFALTLPYIEKSTLFLLGDIVLKGRFTEPWPNPPAIGIWPEAPEATTKANFGVRLEGGRIVELVEKPSDCAGLICGIGVYLLAAEHLREFVHTPLNSRTGEREITEALRELLRREYKIRPMRFSGTYLNVNGPADVGYAMQLLSTEESDQERVLAA